jgi:hypothetical protein
MRSGQKKRTEAALGGVMEHKMDNAEIREREKSIKQICAGV